MGEIDPVSDFGIAFVRLGLATALGAAVGMNRELQHKPAGLRTHALVGLGSALAVYLSIEVTVSGKATDLGAVTRAIQGILTGIGFLGAGVIFREEGTHTVKGLNTAASIWVVACLGMACGAGRWPSVLVGLGMTLAILIFGGPTEQALHRLLYRPAKPGSPEAGSQD